MKKILVPVDGSKTAMDALEFACDIAHAEKSELILVHVCDVSPVFNKLCEGFGEQILKDAQNRVKKRIKKVSTIFSQGTPYEEILKIAKKEGVFAIVMGTHGQTGLHRMLLGSVADRVLRGADCPVILIPKAGGKDY